MTTVIVAVILTITVACYLYVAWVTFTERNK